LKFVEPFDQCGGVLVATSGVVGDPVLPDLEGVAVAGVDRPDQMAVERRLVVVVGDRAGERTVVRIDAGGCLPDGQVAAQFRLKDVVVAMSSSGTPASQGSGPLGASRPGE
jgi:hypothetical protein